MKFRDILVSAGLVSAISICGTLAADTGDRVERRLDNKGDRIENRLDIRGDRINNHLDLNQPWLTRMGMSRLRGVWIGVATELISSWIAKAAERMRGWIGVAQT